MRLILAAFALLVLAGQAGAKWSASYASQPADVQAWFKQQHNSRGEWCCDSSDGHPFFGDYKLNDDGSVTIEPGTPSEHHIVADLVLKGTNPTGHAVWWFRDTVSGHRDYCFSPGTMS